MTKPKIEDGMNKIKKALKLVASLLREISLAAQGNRSAKARIRLLIVSVPVHLSWTRRLSRPCSHGLVSIITPTYNRHEKLKEAIESVRKQDDAHWEMLVVADGPDDQVRKIVSEYGDHRLKYLDTPWIGFRGNHQRNIGTLMAHWEFLLYLDDDNILYPAAISQFRGGFTDTGIGYVICPIDYGEQVMMPTPELRLMEVDTLNFMIRRAALKQAGPWRWQEACDHDLIHRVSNISHGVFIKQNRIGNHRP